MVGLSENHVRFPLIIELAPPSFKFSFMQTLAQYCRFAALTCLSWMHCDGTPIIVSVTNLMVL